VLFLSKNLHAQNLYFESIQDQRFIDRMHTLYGHNGDSFQVNTPLSSMADAYNLYQFYKTDVYNGVLSYKDIYKLNQYIVYQSDMQSNIQDPIISTPSFFGVAGIYNNSPFLFEKKGDFNWVIQPVLSSSYYYNVKTSGEQDAFGHLYAGVYTRMTFNERLGFQARFLYKYEYLNDAFNVWAYRYNAVPGYMDNYQQIQFAYNKRIYFKSILPTAQLTYDIIPAKMSAHIGFDNFHIGEGVRSLILGQDNAPFPYLALKTKFGRFDYTNLFFKPTSQNAYNSTLPFANTNKYVALHYLGVNIGKRFNIGLFESVTMSRDNGPELSYFNPAILYRAVERHLGSPDKMALGITASAVVAKGLKFYGQFFINEFIVKELLAGDGYIHNKWGLQLGAKYYNVANIDNLDFQAEVNLVRPYAYQHRSNSNFSHGNMPLAHPLGANFKEALFNLSYMPMTKLKIQARALTYLQGLDKGDGNYGSNILKDIRTVPYRYGIKIGNGEVYKVFSGELSAQYEVLPHLFVELGGFYRKDNTIMTGQNTSIFASVMFHLNRRDVLMY